jgi:DegV family protein with EDD domain
VTGDIAIVTDSAAMLPTVVAEQHGIIVAPLDVVLDGQSYLDVVELTADELYARLPTTQQVSTSQPPPARLLECYERAARDGARAILSIHIGAGISGTINSAQAAAASSPAPVTIVDTGQASFAEGLCVLEAADALVAGADVAAASAAARAAGAAVGNTFVVKALDLARRGGRLRDAAAAAPGAPAAGVPVLALQPDGMKVAGNASTLDEAVELMAEHIAAAADAAGAADKALRIGIGNGAAAEIAAALRARVERMPHIGEIIDYVVGPSMGAHLGPGNAGAVFIARPISR